MEIDERREDEENGWNGIEDDDYDADDVPAFFKEEMELKLKLGETKEGKRKRKNRVSELVREKVREVLEQDTELADKRARVCHEGDFLKMLWRFNENGIHFN